MVEDKIPVIVFAEKLGSYRTDEANEYAQKEFNFLMKYAYIPETDMFDMKKVVFRKNRLFQEAKRCLQGIN